MSGAAAPVTPAKGGYGELEGNIYPILTLTFLLYPKRLVTLQRGDPDLLTQVFAVPDVLGVKDIYISPTNPNHLLYPNKLVTLQCGDPDLLTQVFALCYIRVIRHVLRVIRHVLRVIRRVAGAWQHAPLQNFVPTDKNDAFFVSYFYNECTC